MSWSRRNFLVTGSLTVAAGAALPRWLLAQEGKGGFEELRRNAGIFRGQGGTIGWIVSDGGIVVVDSQFPASATTCVEGLGKRSERKIDALINTHHHRDHTGGNAVFRPKVGQIVAHRNVPELQRRAAEQRGESADESLTPDTLFDGGWKLDLGDETVAVEHFGPGHTGGDCIVHFQAANVVHMGDLVFNRWFPFIDRPGGASVQRWARQLGGIAANFPQDTIFIFGHGREGFGITGTRDDLVLQRDYLEALLDTAQKGITAGKSLEEIKKLTVPGFHDHVSPGERLSTAANLEVAYEELKAS
jgi:glyoxylase-like metal-dependent hydrolase (beta-lactamase superfamily II)